ncbi:hypothetical protein [Streptomyces sp. NPDC021020]|uniref:hypothetical protein n=1 Tax=Streptomyces sp. NPDC021020 TaxID=3365109 RepID=UPI0037A872BF
MTLRNADPVGTAVARVADEFAGMTARRDEAGCGRCFDEDEIALLRRPAVPLPEDLVRRVAQKEPGHWGDQAAVVRRVLPQLVVMLSDGADEPETMARGLAAAGWPRWPAGQADAVAAFLDAWWARTLRTASPPTPPYEVFATCATATSTVTPWLARWSAEPGPTARHHLRECVEWWQEDLESDTSPFSWWWGDETERRAAWAELMTWLGVRP